MTHIPHMLAIGTATQDVFLSGDVFKPHHLKHQLEEELPLGAKLAVEQVTFSTGGNAMNASVTFARQGLHAEFMGIIGTEPAGEVILRALDNEGIEATHVVHHERYKTSYSTILLAPTGERTILNFAGSVLRDDGDPLDLQVITHADWLYLSSVKNFPLLEKIVHLASTHNVRVAFNPSVAELAKPQKLKALLADVDVLLVNKEEAQRIVEGESLEELVRHAAHYVPTVVVSDGAHGVVATDSHQIVQAGVYDSSPVIDRTGAGDAFGSGFVASIARGETLSQAITLASANATSVVGKIGATEGILHVHASLHDMDMKITDF